MSKKSPDSVEPQSRISQRRSSAKSKGKADYAAKRAEIVKAAAEVFREKGYQATTLNDIAARLGTDRASLYYYVADKEELFHESIKDVLEANLKQAQEITKGDRDPIEKLHSLVHMLLESYEANYPHMYVYIQEDMARIAASESSWATDMVAQTRKMDRLFQTVIQQAIDAGEFRDDVSAHVAAYALFGMLNWTHRWFEPGKRLSTSELADSFASIFTDGMRPAAS